MSDIADLCGALDKEPLLHASLGSKELFHSNMLARMIERFPDRARDALADVLVPAPDAGRDRVRREFRMLDLVVELAGHQPVVIENKTFSLPDEEQLHRYAEGPVRSLDGHPSLVLLSLLDPGWPGGELPTVDGGTWRYLSYRHLGERLRDTFPRGRDFEQDVMAHEARLMLLLDDLVSVAGTPAPGDRLTLPESAQSSLRTVRLADAVSKARTHWVRQKISTRVRHEGTACPEKPFKAGFSNGQPLLEGFWRKDDGLLVGWQFQGAQWRLAMVFDGELKGRGGHARRAAVAAKHLDYFDFAPLHDVLSLTEEDTRPARVHPSGFNRFDPDFVYRYRLVPDRTVAELVELAVTYSRWAAEWTPGAG